MPKINKLSFTFFLLFTLFFINSCGKSSGNNNDTINLKVSSTTPSDRDENIEINTNIIFTFNESINESSIGNDNLSILDTNGNVVNGNIRVVGNRVIFDPSSDLAYDTKYNISLTKSIKGENGATLNSIYSFSFTTKKEIKANEKPSKPTNLITSNITQLSIKISWNASTDNDGNINSYYVSYKKENGLYYSEMTTTDTFKVFTYLEPKTRYSFKIRAKDNDGGFSDYAYSPSATTLEKINQKPTPPTSIQLTNITHNSISISWNGSNDSDGNIASYLISYKILSGDYGNEQSTNSVTKVFNNLPASTVYTFRIRAKDNDGEYSDYAYISSVATLQSTNQKPTPPTNIQLTNITQNSITVSWNSSSDSDGNIVSYLISYKTSSGNYGNEKSTNSVTKIINSLTASTDYTFRIRAKDNDGEYSDYAYSSITTTSQAIGEQGSIEGSIKDKITNENIKGATINTGNHTTTSNDNGSYQIANLSYGTHRLRVSLNGYEVNEQDIIISQSNTIKDILLTKSSASLKGVVKNTNGNLLASVSISLGTINITTDTNGAYVINNIIIYGERRINASLENYKAYQENIQINKGYTIIHNITLEIEENKLTHAIPNTSGIFLVESHDD